MYAPGLDIDLDLGDLALLRGLRFSDQNAMQCLAHVLNSIFVLRATFVKFQFPRVEARKDIYM